MVSQTELNNLLNILGNLNEQIMRMPNKQKVEDVALHECPPDNIKICKICAGSHATKDCPSLLGLKALYQKDNGVNQAPRGSWQPHQPNMIQYPCA